MTESSDRFYFRQLLSGRDFALDDPVAQQMVNFVYLIGDRATGEAVAVDPAYGVADLLDILGQDGMRLTGVLATHYHPDHVGGSMMGFNIEGVKELLDLQGVKIHVQAEEAELVKKVTEVSDSDLEIHSSGDRVMVGDVAIELIHTPGHTQGSVCYYTDELLFSGDTLFAGSIGRTDFPGGDYKQEMASIIDKLLKLPDDTIVLPGHMQQTTIGNEREMNPFVIQELRDRGQL